MRAVRAVACESCMATPSSFPSPRMFPRRNILPPLHDAPARPMSHRVCRLLHFPNMMRNILRMLCVAFSLLAAAAWAADPLVGPGKVGEKDAKGHVKGADTGAGPH